MSTDFSLQLPPHLVEKEERETHGRCIDTIQLDMVGKVSLSLRFRLPSRGLVSGIRISHSAYRRTAWAATSGSFERENSGLPSDRSSSYRHILFVPFVHRRQEEHVEQLSVRNQGVAGIFIFAFICVPGSSPFSFGSIPAVCSVLSLSDGQTFLLDSFPRVLKVRYGFLFTLTNYAVVHFHLRWWP
jgi:hypothetical protein